MIRSKSNLSIDLRSELKAVPFSKVRFQTIGESILKKLGLRQTTVSVLLTDNRRIQRYNRRYLNHDQPTDVIAFSYLESKRGNSKRNREINLLGDVIISWTMAKRQSKIYGNTPFYELCFYLCHGILHLIGYDDKTKRQAKRMENLQKRLLQKLIPGNPSR